MKKTGPTNPNTKDLITELKKKSYEHKSKLWKRIAEELSKPTRQRRTVNLYKINKYAKYLIENPKNLKSIITFLHKKESSNVAELGAKLAQLDSEFKLWALIETTFLENIENSHTDFINGYTYIIFNRYKSFINSTKKDAKFHTI